MKKIILSILIISIISSLILLLNSSLYKEDIKITNSLYNVSLLELQVKTLNDNYCKLEEEKEDLIYEQVIREQELIEPFKYTDMENYIIQYNNIVSKYSEYLDVPEVIEDYYTEEQINMMLSCIETEAYQCSFEAKVNVATVIFNRVENELYPTDPIEVVTATNQFAYGREIITEDTKLALEYAWLFQNTNLDKNCIGFRSDKLVKDWNGWKYIYTDGYHYFYSMKGDD
jgi:hypothetical protein